VKAHGIELPGRGRRDDLPGIRPLVAASLASFAAFGLLAILVAADLTASADRAVTLALQSVASLPLDLVANANTFIGQATVTSVIAVAVAAVLWRSERGGAWLAVGLLAVTVAGEVALKFAFDHPAPPPVFDRSLWDPLGVHVVSPSSFPSGHVARVTFLAILLAGLARGGFARLPAVALVAYSVWSRVYLGDHWLSDAVGGLALGAGAGLAALAWIARCRARATDVTSGQAPMV
jgi:undecaprenyl-diphosphatase